jgi:hypothetical protein
LGKTKGNSFVDDGQKEQDEREGALRYGKQIDKVAEKESGN